MRPFSASPDGTRIPPVRFPFRDDFPAVVASAAVIASFSDGWPGFVGFVLFFSGVASAWAIVGLEMIAVAWLDLETDRPGGTRRTVTRLNRTPLYVVVMTSALASGFVLAAAGRGGLSGGLFVTTVIVPGAAGITHLGVWAFTELSGIVDTS